MLVILHLSLSSTVCRIFVSWYLCIYTSKWSHCHSHSTIVCCIFVSSYLRIFRKKDMPASYASSYLRILVSTHQNGYMVTVIPPWYVVSSYLRIFVSSHQNSHMGTAIPPRYVVSLYLRIFASSEKKTCLPPMHLRIFVSWYLHIKMVTW